MLKAIARITEHPVIAGLFVALIVWAVTGWAGWWPTIMASFVSRFLWLGQTSAVANWLIVVMGILSARAILAILVGLWAFTNKGKATVEQDHSETIWSLRWRWCINPISGAMDVHPFCPSCDLQLDPKYAEYSVSTQMIYRCFTCHGIDITLDGNVEQIERRAALEIQRRIRTQPQAKQ